jgi:hypothetical protein
MLVLSRSDNYRLIGGDEEIRALKMCLDFGRATTSGILKRLPI